MTENVLWPDKRTSLLTALNKRYHRPLALCPTFFIHTGIPKNVAKVFNSNKYLPAKLIFGEKLKTIVCYVYTTAMTTTCC